MPSVQSSGAMSNDQGLAVAKGGAYKRLLYIIRPHNTQKIQITPTKNSTQRSIINFIDNANIRSPKNANLSTNEQVEILMILQSTLENQRKSTTTRVCVKPIIVWKYHDNGIGGNHRPHIWAIFNGSSKDIMERMSQCIKHRRP